MCELKIAQSSKALDDAYWEWSVWIEAAVREMTQIKLVIWKLHPTFPTPIVVRTNPKNKFRLDTAGWGTFQIAAEIQLKSGKSIHVTHELEFEAPPAKRTQKKPPTKKKPQAKIMLSFAAVDAGVAGELRALLESKGAKVIEAAQGRSGLSPAAMVREAVKQSDALIAIHDETNPSRWVQVELEQAKDHNRPVLALDRSSALEDVPGAIRQVSDFLSKVPTS